jgi:hypothetical protein
MERRQGTTGQPSQECDALSPEEQLRLRVKGFPGNKSDLERNNAIPLDWLDEQELKSAVSIILKLAVLDIVSTEGTLGLLRIRKYCGDELILRRLVEAFRQMFACDALHDPKTGGEISEDLD